MGISIVMKKNIISLVLIFIGTFFSSAQVQLSDSAKISLLTFSANTEVHAMYGHSAIRVSDSTQNIDFVFNYGTFDFNAPYFVYRFIEGKTDYILSGTDYATVIYDAVMRNIAITEQELNLTLDEKNRFWNNLLVNIKPENRNYRYNFLFDNCALRPLWMLQHSLDGKIEFVESDPQTTFRQLLHDCLSRSRWLTFGVDLVLGGSIDTPVTFQERLFLPHYLMTAFDQAVIIRGDERVPLVVRENDLMGAEEEEYEEFPISPLMSGIILLITVVLISLVAYKRKRVWIGFDQVLLFIYGVAGSIIWFLIFVSEHPAVSPNWNGVWLHPFYLLMFILLFIPLFKRFYPLFCAINVFLIALFYLVRITTIQQFNPAVDLFVLPLWIRSGEQLLLWVQSKRGLTQPTK